MVRAKHKQSGGSSLARFLSLVEQTAAIDLQELCLFVYGGPIEHASQENSGIRLHLRGLRPIDIRTIDFEEWARIATSRREAREERRAELLEEAQEQARVDKIKLDRMKQLTACITQTRRLHREQTCAYLSKEEILEMIHENKGVSGGWHTKSKNKGIPVSLAEVGWCWETLWHFNPWFIAAETKAEAKLLFEQVPQLQPLQQEQDARGCVRYRTNGLSSRKLRSSVLCVLEALLFATGEEVRA